MGSYMPKSITADHIATERICLKSMASCFAIKGTSKNSIKQMMARQKQAKKRSLHIVNEHFELVFNAASAASVDF